MTPDEYARAFEAGALAALDYVTDERLDLDDLTMRVAEKIGADITAMLKPASDDQEIGR